MFQSCSEKNSPAATFRALVVCLILVGCVSAPTPAISGRYVDKSTGGYIVFRQDGRFYYSFTNPSPPLARDGLPKNMGQYWFNGTNDTVPFLSVRSAHAGQFVLRFSDSKDKVYLNSVYHPEKEIEFERVAN
jgi:hypothetical protein